MSEKCRPAQDISLPLSGGGGGGEGAVERAGRGGDVVGVVQHSRVAVGRVGEAVEREVARLEGVVRAGRGAAAGAVADRVAEGGVAAGLDVEAGVERVR